MIIKIVLIVKYWMENIEMTNVFFFFNIKNVWRSMPTQILIKENTNLN